MIANPSKFHATLLSKNCTLTGRTPVKIKENQMEGKTKVDPLGLKIDNRLSFTGHISAICKKAAKQLNTLKRLKFSEYLLTQSISKVIYHDKLQLLSSCATFLFS